MELGLDGKSVIVTGGASNIGRAIVLAFTAEGASVTIGDLDEEQARRVAQQATQASGAKVEVVKTDTTSPEQATRLVTAARDSFGSLDVLVNSVGWDRLLFFMQTDPELWRRIVEVNYMSVLNCTRAALEVMVAQEHGTIVSISSDASRQGEPREAVYAGTKAAINAFMKTIARENGRYGIRCNVVCPGVTVPQPNEMSSASMWRQKEVMFTDEQLEKVARSLPLRKLTRAEDVANAVLFLASDSVAGDITGQVLSVSGGYSMVG